jgi:oxygen-independent coproporphyrinogen-3 oxidase
MAGLYIHIPFCKQACHYCDFHFSTNRKESYELCKAIGTELRLQRNYLGGEPLKTIYLGGGTPSLLSRKELDFIFDEVSKSYTVDAHPEITLEANPDDLTSEKLADLQQTGVNRLSIGIQSFDSNVLKFLNRAHDAKAALNCVDLARNAGFNNLSIDLIYAIPGQDNVAWKKSLRQAISLSPEHISSYSLSIEEKTTFGRWQRAGKFKAVDEEIAAQQFEILMEELERAGYEEQTNYLGVGPSAHSYNGNTRQFNVLNNHLYVKSLAENKIPFQMEVLSPANKINEYIFTTLRTSKGCNFLKVKQELGYDIQSRNAVYLNNIIDTKLAFMDNEILRLTRSGKLLADKIASDLFAEEDQN